MFKKKKPKIWLFIPVFAFSCTNKPALSMHKLKFINKIIKTILINKRDKCGQTRLHRACCFNKPQKVTNLLGYKNLDPNIKDKFGRTPLHEACIQGNLEIVALLLKNLKINININLLDNNGKSAIFLACLNNYPEIVRLLIKKRAIIDKKTLEFAKNKPEVLELLN